MTPRKSAPPILLRLRAELRRFVEQQSAPAGRGRRGRQKQLALAALQPEWSDTTFDQVLGDRSCPVNKDGTPWGGPKSEALARFCRAAGVNGHWLLTGEGEARPLAAAVEAFINANAGDAWAQLQRERTGYIDGDRALRLLTSIVSAHALGMVNHLEARDALARLRASAGKAPGATTDALAVSDGLFLPSAPRLDTVDLMHVAVVNPGPKDPARRLLRRF